jgi:hypothetical protein
MDQRRCRCQTAEIVRAPATVRISSDERTARYPAFSVSFPRRKSSARWSRSGRMPPIAISAGREIRIDLPTTQGIRRTPATAAVAGRRTPSR